MKGTIWLIILFFSLLFIPASAQSGPNIEYTSFGPRVKEPPTVCAIAPDPDADDVLTESFAERMLKETKTGVMEWDTKLKAKTTKNNWENWNITYEEIPFYDVETFDFSHCTIFITFQAKPDDENDHFKHLGITEYEAGKTGRANIKIFYENIKWCVSDDANFYYYDPCYSGEFRTSDQIGTVARHEFGHALGLGHYQSDDQTLNLAWSKGGVVVPSIMIIFSHENTQYNVIQPIDIEKVYEIYGENGFNWNTQKEEIIFESLSTSKSLYIISPHTTQEVTIKGKIAREQYLSGHPVIVTVTLPDETSQTFEARLGSDGTFEGKYSFDENTLAGMYHVEADFVGKKSESLSFEILPPQHYAESTVEKIPRWIKTTAKWWSADEVSDDDFVKSIRYLIEEEIIKIEPIQQTTQKSSSQVPQWLKTYAGWWSNGTISETEFIDGIQYLVKNGIIQT